MPHAFVVVLGTILACLILLVDLLTVGEVIKPHDFSYVVGGVPYVAVVLTTLWMPGRNYTIIFAVLTSLLTLAVLFVRADRLDMMPWIELSYQQVSLGLNIGSPLVSRALAVFSIWITAILTIQRKKSEERGVHLSAIVESSNDAIIGKSLEGIITSWNTGATQIYQYGAREVIGQHISLLWPKGSTGEAQREILRKIREGHLLESLETLRRRKDGTLVNVSITFSPTRDDAGSIVGLAEIARDITDRKKFEQALIEAKENAERMSRLKSSFLTNMSHEIRTPLSGILGFASILAQDANPEQLELAQLIEKSGRRLLDTINSVLDLSMLESDSFSLHPRPVDMVAEVKEKVELLQPLARRSNLFLRAQVPDRMCVTRIDTACLDRILNNLIGNAIKFTNSGGVTVNVDADSDYVQVRVVDTGIGIGDDFKGRLFQEFEQESSGMARLYEGSGLGLSITKRLVELMDGKIYVESEQGRGSEFVVQFPISQEAVPEPARPKRRRAPNRVPLRNAKVQILIVDDDPRMRTLLRLMLQSTCKIDMAEDEQKALSLASTTRYDMILQDVNLGRARSGIDVLREFRKLPDYDTVPVVALTAYALPKDREHLLGAGFDEYLSKPISEDDLRRVIGTVLKEEHLNGQLEA